jgi:hypothetical protein
MIALFYLKAGDSLAMSVGRQSVELAGATVRAIAVDELTSFDHPFGVGHRHLPTYYPSAKEIAPADCREG